MKNLKTLSLVGVTGLTIGLLAVQNERSASAATKLAQPSIQAEPAGDKDSGPTFSLRPEFEYLDGFGTVVLNQVNQSIGSDKLVPVMGSPIEPGIYVGLSMKSMTVFDRVALTFNDGRVADKTLAADCLSGCPRASYAAFRRAWLDLEEEATAVSVQLPDRMLFAAEGALPARTLVESIYAAVEARTVEPVPNLHLLTFTRRAGLRAIAVHMMPPEGLNIRRSAKVLGLRVELMGGGRYRLSASGRQFPRVLELDGLPELTAALADIKENFPGKSSLIVDVGEVRPGEGEAAVSATVRELIEAATAMPDEYSNVILAAGQRIQQR